MQVDGIFIMKRTLTKFYRAAVVGTFSTQQQLMDDLRSRCVVETEREDMPAEEDHFSAVLEATGESPKDLDLKDGVKLTAAVASLLTGLDDVARDALLESLKKQKVKP